MITSPELKDSIEQTTTSKVALIGVSHRLADALTKALTAEGVTFHAVNEEHAVTIQPGVATAKLVLKQQLYGGPLTWRVSLGLGVDDEDASLAPPECVTTFADSEIAVMTGAWAKLIAGVSRHIVFRNLYIPKSVEMTDGYNDLRVAFRFVRAYDPVRSQYIVRFDCAFKNLAA
jgi:hypothetical protein